MATTTLTTTTTPTSLMTKFISKIRATTGTSKKIRRKETSVESWLVPHQWMNFITTMQNSLAYLKLIGGIFGSKALDIVEMGPR